MALDVLQGVVKALFQHGLLPRVLAGSSVGSIGEDWYPGMLLIMFNGHLCKQGNLCECALASAACAGHN